MRQFTLVELMIVVAIIGILAAIAIPSFVEFQLRAKRAELPVNVDGMGTAAIAALASHDAIGWVDCMAAPDATPGKSRRPWVGTDADCFDAQYGWAPDGDVYGSYTLDLFAVGVAVAAGTHPGESCQTPSLSGGWGAYGQADVNGDLVTHEDLEVFGATSIHPAPALCHMIVI